MFPRFVCEICGCKLDHNGTTCKKHAKQWIESLTENATKNVKQKTNLESGGKY